MKTEVFKVVPPGMPNDTREKISPKEVFLQILAVAALYVTAGSLIALLFQYVNYLFPDPLSLFQDTTALRWAIASLVILFPVHIIAMRLLEREYMRDPHRRERRLRKWLLYLTLFLASLLLIGDLVSLIFNFLNGELTARFLFKVLSIAIVAGGAFWYYLWELRRAHISKNARIGLWVASLLIFASVFSGFFVIGSPFAQRLVRFDIQRINDLSLLQSQIVSYWQQKGKLPDSLDNLKDNISGFVPPVDPETGKPYEYHATGNLSFQLCATFAKSSDAKNPAAAPYYRGIAYYRGIRRGIRDIASNWNHSAGRVCFDRTIDPQLYKASSGSIPSNKY